jgi:hypothetical protein
MDLELSLKKTISNIKGNGKTISLMAKARKNDPI